MKTLSIDWSVAQPKAHAIAIEKNNGLCLGPGVSEKMEELNRISAMAAKRSPKREFPKIHHIDLEFCIQHGIVTECYPMENGCAKIIMLGNDKLCICKLIVYLSLSAPGSSAPLIVEDFWVAPND